MTSGLSGELLILVVGNFISAAFMLGGGLFVFLHNWKKPNNRAFFFLTISTFLFTLFFAIASMQTNYESAYFWWSLNIVDVLIAMATVQLIFNIIDRVYEWRWFIGATYILGFIIMGVSFLEPSWFLPHVIPKLYFPYYLDAGWWYVVMIVYFFTASLTAFGALLHAYFTGEGAARKRYEYFILVYLVGYTIGGWNFLLVFNIPADPIFGMPVWLYLIPVAYGIFSSDLLDIRIVAKRAVFYAIGIGSVTALLASLILLNNYLTKTIPSLQFWTVPAVVAVIGFIVGRIVLSQARETDKLKYEFITIATHKLRTPLTQIRWSVAELMAQAGDNQPLREGLRRIDESNNRLIELTTDLMEAAHSGDGTNGYQKGPVDLVDLATKALTRFNLQITEKKLEVTRLFEKAGTALGDTRSIESVVTVFVENAITYTPPGGTLKVEVEKTHHGVRFAVTDSGIGVPAADRDRIFKSFFRTEKAKTSDTEGVGLGLSLAKSTIERQGGEIGFSSEGEGKGSTFWFILPASE